MYWLPKILCCGMYMQPGSRDDVMHCLYCGRVVTPENLLHDFVKSSEDDEDASEEGE